MKVIRLIVATSLIVALAACSDDGSSPVPANDDVDATNYRAKLSTALEQLRGNYFTQYIEATASANQLFRQPLPRADEYFGPEPFPTGTDSNACDSGSVTRNVVASDARALTIAARFDFENCELQSSVINGTVEIELDGDTPSRLGGQIGRVVMQFLNVEIKSDLSPDTTRILTGTFKSESGWGAAYLAYTHEYVTESYQTAGGDESDATEVLISSARYTQQMESDYFDPELAYYRLSESGSLASVVTQGQVSVEFNINIEPNLIYASRLDVNNFPVYDDDVLTGTVTYTQLPTGSVTAMSLDSTSELIRYVVNDGVNSFSEVDEWQFPIDCDDNSAMNRRNLCDLRR